MRRDIVWLIARHFLKSVFKTHALYLILLVVLVILGYASYSGWKIYTVQNSIRHEYQQQARESWEANPDKHPHRMAHFGSFAFRLKHPMSMIDFGMESFTGNVVFLEAHKQNTVNFSEASHSTALLRFGEVSMAMLLQLIFPLIIFFIGASSLAPERENGILKVLLTQGGRWKEILFGKCLGLMIITLILFVPAAIASLLLVLTANESPDGIDVLQRYGTVMLAFMMYFWVLCAVAVCVSAFSATSRTALMKLLGLWLVFFILMPRTTQAFGSYLYPSPSKIELETEVEQEIIQLGDSHNPDDAHYRALRDSVLRVHKVDSVEKLPFNYSGFVGREGEKLSAEVYTRHMNKLMNTYRMQNLLARNTGFVNPFLAVRHLSMALSGSDFEAYVSFQEQAEEYRYQLAQQMNELQMKYISNKKPGPDDTPYTISREHWKEFPDFNYRFLTIKKVFSNEIGSIAAICWWFAVSISLILYLSNKAKAV